MPSIQVPTGTYLAYAAAPSGGDDLATLQAIVNAVPSTGGTIQLQPGTYSLSGELSVPEHVRLQGVGSAWENFGLDAHGTTLRLVTSSGLTSSSAVVRFVYNGVVSDRRHQGGASDVTFDGNAGAGGTDNSTVGVIAAGVRFLTFTRCSFVRAGNDGFKSITATVSCNELRFTDCFAGWNGAHGFEINGGDIALNGLIAGVNTLDGIRIVAGATAVTGCSCWNNLRDGLSVSNAASVEMVSVTGGEFYDNARSGISLDSGAKNITINGVACHGNGSDTTTYPTATDRAGIRVVGAPTNIVIDGCVLGNRAANSYQQYGVAATSATNGVGVKIGVNTGTNAVALYKNCGPSYNHVVAHGESTVNVVNTTTETIMWTYTIPGGSLKAGDRLRVWMSGDLLNNSSGAVTYAPKVVIGTTAILNGATGSMAQSANRRQVVLEVVLVCVDGTNQRASAEMLVSGANATAFPSQTNATTWVGTGAATETSSADLTFKFTITMGTADANADFNMKSYVIEKLPA